MANVNYFKNVETLEDVWEKLIENLQEIDPKNRSFKTMTRQYEKEYLKHISNHTNKKGEPYIEKFETPPDKFLNIILGIFMMDGVQLERVGTWLWASGNTKTHREDLIKLGFWWNKKRLVWQWHDPAQGKGRNSKKGTKALKAVHGNVVIKANAEEEGAA